MPYEFPSERTRTGEPLDPQALDESLNPAARRISGNLGPHNLSSLHKTGSTVAAGAYWLGHLTHTTFDPELYGNTEPPRNPAGAEYKIPATFEWEAVESDSITTGNDVLCIWGFAQFSASYAGSIGLPARQVQFALRVDGQIFDVTGKADELEKPQKPFKTPDAKANDYSRRVLKSYQTIDLNAKTAAYRLFALVPVAEGTHNVELLVRRSRDQSDGSIHKAKWGTVYNRRLFVLQLRGGASPPTAGAAVELPATESGDTLSQAALSTNRLEVLRSAANDLDASHISRGALLHPHLPSQVNYAVNSTYDPGANQTITAQYPGYATTPASWTTLWTETNGGAGFTLTADGWLIILVNVALVGVEDSASTSANNAFAVFDIGYTAGGVEYLLNAHAMYNSESGAQYENIDAQLLCVLPTSAGTGTWSNINVKLTAYRSGTTTARAIVRSGTMQILHLKA
jgi:hypothetical protein